MKQDLDKLNRARSFFPHLDEGVIYLNHAATGPYSRPVQEAMDAYIRQRSSEKIENYPVLMGVIENTLQSIGEMINAPAENIEFAPNTSYGLNVLAGGINWEAGDRILIPACEFPANVYPFLQLRSQGVEVDFVPHVDGTFTIGDIEKRITSRTRLLTLSWVQFLSGFRCDLEAIGTLCKEKGILFCVDAIQGLGALQMDVQKAGIDFLSTGGHKWLLSTQGIGFFYVSSNLFEELTPMWGWLNGPVDWESLMEYKMDLHPDSRRFRLGTLNGIGISALGASLELYRSLGMEWCERNVLSINMYLREQMNMLGFSLYGVPGKRHMSGISTFQHPEVTGLFDVLDTERIHVALRNNLLRISPGYYTSTEDIDKVISVLTHALNR